jgi:hypothetical protein
VTLAQTGRLSATAEPAGTGGGRQWPCRGVRVSAAAASGALVVLGWPLLAQAAAPTMATFTFSGAVRGTVHLPDGICAGSGGQFKITGRTLMGFKAKRWTLNVNSPTAKGGTWKKFTPNALGSVAVSVVLQGQASAKVFDWITRSGRLTTSKSSGSLNVVLGPDHSLSGVPGSGTVHVTGSWGCLPG